MESYRQKESEKNKCFYLKHMNKRLQKEIITLYTQQALKPLLENDYLIHYSESDGKVSAIVKPHRDSVYKHKFIRFDFEIPDTYPNSPPVLTFLNYDNVRIHPNLYENGKCCSTILNTWPGNNDEWTSSMGIETILLTFQSFLDNNPYTYEPGGRDDPSYTVYVKHQSWWTCLIKYLENETIQSFKNYMQTYLICNASEIFEDLDDFEDTFPYGHYYTRCFEIEWFTIDYDRIKDYLQYYCNYMDYVDCIEDKLDNCDELSRGYKFDKDYKAKKYGCSICFDTIQNMTHQKLSCAHEFHKKCLTGHVKHNTKVCPMCRTNLSESDLEILNNETKSDTEWIINPESNRKVKVGSRTWNYLKEYGII